MNKEKKISDKKIEKILSRCMILLSKGFDVDFCLSKFKKYKDVLEGYLEIYGKLKKVTDFELDKNFLKDSLDKIYRNSPEKNDISVSKPSRSFMLKPAILLPIVAVIIVFSFTGTLFASQNSVPHEMLYSVKRAIENFKLNIYPKSYSGPLHFDLLKNRINEISTIISSVSYSKEEADSLLSEIDYEYGQSKKYDYFGNQSKDQVLNDIERLKTKYLEKFGHEYHANNTKTIIADNVGFKIEGPIYLKEQNIFYYRVKVEFGEANPDLVVGFNRDDSNGAWGPYVSQINLNQNETFILTLEIPSLSISRSFILVGNNEYTVPNDNGASGNQDETSQTDMTQTSTDTSKENGDIQSSDTQTNQDEVKLSKQETGGSNQATETTADSQAPVISSLSIVPNPAAINSPINVSANIDDSSTGGSIISYAEYSIDNGTSWTALDAADGIYNETKEGVMETINLINPGIYDLLIRAADNKGNISDPVSATLVSYNPLGIFMANNCWINSPEGAYTADASLKGKAAFYINARYLENATMPTGNLEFYFEEANMSFYSNNYNWLVVNQDGMGAQLKGSGTINGKGNYQFMLYTAKGTPDTFHIKIWLEENGGNNIIYDNGADQPVDGGNIEIHN
jgi:hypothetical protein